MKLKFFEQPVLVFSVLTTLLLASSEAPHTTFGISILLILWKWISEQKGIPVLPRKVTGFLSVLLWAQVYLQYKSVLGQESSNALLLGMASLKIMDYENQRDHRFLIMIAFVMLSMKANFSIDVYWILPSLLAFLGLWWALLDPQFKSPLSLLLRVFLAASPIVMALFFIFPRFVVPWATQNSSDVSISGFSDKLDPGGVAELASSEALAFRAKFPRKVMTPDSLYWRGSVLLNSEGLRWTPSGSKQERMARDKDLRKDFDYEVILEPGSKGYLFTLDFPKSIDADKSGVFNLPHSVYRLSKPTLRAQSYRVIQSSESVDTEIPDERALEIPKLSPRVEAWVEDIKSKHQSPKQRLLALRRFFSDSNFVYTLNPGRYDKNELESFLFEKKRGFCEHFAGSFATLARALGLHSRVVVGYQGGLYNPFGDFWRVSQRDAHAWVEIFIDGRWMRNDPASWVAPLRINVGGQNFFSLTEEEQRTLAKSSSWTLLKDSEPKVWNAITLWIDDINYQWTYFLLNFDSESQKTLLAEFSKEMGLIFLSGVLLIVFLLYLLRRFSNPIYRRSKAERQLDKAIRWGESKGVRHEPSLPPFHYLDLLIEKFPEKRKELIFLKESYDSHVYKREEANS